MKIKAIFIVALLALVIMSFIVAKKTGVKNQPNGSPTIDFTSDYKLSNWSILNDGVMGGVSTSSLEINTEGHALFKGLVSTENNGGFASVRFRTSPIKVKSKRFVTIRLKGDGKEYQFRVKKNASDFISYISTFPTSGSWELVKIKLSDLYPSVMGRKLNRANFDATEIEELSLLITRKKTESFKLLVDYIKFDSEDE
jgi:NADH dehydrogenase [ubiquinone] 1 alpha subcomplex assembly factor 1